MRSILVFIFLKFLLFMRFSRHSADSICSISSSKKHMFSSEIRLLLDNLSEKLFLYNQIYMLFPVLSFLIIPSDDLLCDMKHITVSFSDTRKILQARFSVCGRYFSDIIPLHSSALLPGRLYFLCAFMYVIGTLQSNLL